jgi:hypothetical protein
MNEPLKDPPLVPARARRAYEAARLRRALVRAIPASFLFVLLLAEGASPGRLVASLGLYATAVLAHTIGQSAALAVAPSLCFGLVPFVIVRVAEASGHVCMGEMCVSWCLPACLTAGLVGGALVALRGRGVADRPAYLLTSICLVALSGILGCSCAGGAGMAGLALGVVLGAIPAMTIAPASHGARPR